MSIIDKIEDLLFTSRALASIEMVRNRLVILKMRCDIEHLSDSECQLRCRQGHFYKILGKNLQVKEYGDTYVKVIGDKVTGFLIEEGEGGTADE